MHSFTGVQCNLWQQCDLQLDCEEPNNKWLQAPIRHQARRRHKFHLHSLQFSQWEVGNQNSEVQKRHTWIRYVLKKENMNCISFVPVYFKAFKSVSLHWPVCSLLVKWCIIQGTAAAASCKGWTIMQPESTVHIHESISVCSFYSTPVSDNAKIMI